MNRRTNRFVSDPGRVERRRSEENAEGGALELGACSGMADRPECGAGRPRPHQETAPASGAARLAVSTDESLAERILRLAEIAAAMHMGMAVDHQRANGSNRSAPKSEVA